MTERDGLKYPKQPNGSICLLSYIRFSTKIWILYCLKLSLTLILFSLHFLAIPSPSNYFILIFMHCKLSLECSSTFSKAVGLMCGFTLGVSDFKRGGFTHICSMLRPKIHTCSSIICIVLSFLMLLWGLFYVFYCLDCVYFLLIYSKAWIACYVAGTLPVFRYKILWGEAADRWGKWI